MLEGEGEVVEDLLGEGGECCVDCWGRWDGGCLCWGSRSVGWGSVIIGNGGEGVGCAVVRGEDGCVCFYYEIWEGGRGGR